MYTTCNDRKKMISGLYEEWKEKYAENKELLKAVDKVKKDAFREAHKYEPVTLALPLESEVLRHCDQLACFSTDYHGSFIINTTCADSHGLSYYTVHSTNCISCVLFSYFFHGCACGLVIEPELVSSYDWGSLRPILEYTDLKLVIVDLTKSLSNTGDRKYRALIWDLVNDELIGIRQEQGEGYQEIEDGYPIDIAVYWEKFDKLEETKGFLKQKKRLLKQPVPDEKRASAGFLAKKKRYMEQLEKGKR